MNNEKSLGTLCQILHFSFFILSPFVVKKVRIVF